MSEQLTFDPPEKKEPRELLFEMDIPGKLPSWNEILAMEEWQRYRFKKGIQDAFLSALRLSGSDSLMRTTFVRNSMLIAAATLASWQMTMQAKRKLKSAKKKLALKNRSLFESKSSGKVPF